MLLLVSSVRVRPVNGQLFAFRCYKHLASPPCPRVPVFFCSNQRNNLHASLIGSCIPQRSVSCCSLSHYPLYRLNKTFSSITLGSGHICLCFIRYFVYSTIIKWRSEDKKIDTNFMSVLNMKPQTESS